MARNRSGHYCRRDILDWYVDRVRYPRRPRRIYVVRCECGRIRHI